MSAIRKITTTSQLKSANTTTDIKFHSGKEGRGIITHANENIDKSRSHLNIEFDMFKKEELLEEHYGEKIEKHNKNNKSAARHWDMDKFLATFEGKEVKSFGRVSKNARWATASQLSYFGGTDSLNPVLEELEQAGASQEEIMDAYTAGYRDYIEEHNETFKTMPIYHSDIHYDESTPHGHDAIVLKGHTKKGNPSDSLNMALAEHYDSDDYDAYEQATKSLGRKETMSMYRDENDEIIFRNVGSKLEDLAEQYGLDIEFEQFRTGAVSAPDFPSYLHQKRLEDEKDDLTLKKRDFNRARRDETTKLTREAKAIGITQKELSEREKAIIDNENKLKHEKRDFENEKDEFKSIKTATVGVVVEVLKYSNAKFDEKMRVKIENEGIESVSKKELVKSLDFSIMDAIKNKKEEELKLGVQKAVAVAVTVAEKPKVKPVVAIRDDGPEL